MSQAETDRLSLGSMENLLAYRLRSAQYLLFTVHSEVFGRHGITPGLYGILIAIRYNPGCSQIAVCNRLKIDSSAMVAALDKLEKLGLVERRPSPTDRRQRALYLTDRGESVMTETEAQVTQQEQEVLKEFSAQERATLMALLERFDR
ncbi:MAG: MarR family transcriptional regulator [Oceanospirillaceae bacterium]|nr:MarR family transcriptional regulator [Oceanospirillaceae bacterium]